MSKIDSNEDVVDVADIVETKDDAGNDTTDWKAIALERTEAARKNKGIAQRYKTKVEKSKEKPDADPIPQNEPTSNDLGEKAFLAVNGIKSADEVAFFKKMKKETGKDAEALLDSTYFQTEFKDFKEKNASSSATPNGGSRSNNSSNNTVEYWLAKGELPPASEVQLRRDVVNARMKKEENKGVFYNS